MLQPHPHGVDNLHDYLAGPWSLLRIIEDHRAAAGGTYFARADFRPASSDESQSLSYEERGRVSLGTYRGAGYRHYGFHFPTPSLAAVTFDDGRAFHDLDLTAGQWSATHFCSPDRYQGQFHCLGPQAWRVTWRITGPRKDLTLTSHYLRFVDSTRPQYEVGG